MEAWGTTPASELVGSVASAVPEVSSEVTGAVGSAPSPDATSAAALIPKSEPKLLLFLRLLKLKPKFLFLFYSHGRIRNCSP